MLLFNACERKKMTEVLRKFFLCEQKKSRSETWHIFYVDWKLQLKVKQILSSASTF